MTLRLLVADDSVTIQKMVALAFEGEDASIHAVSSGDAAVEAMAAVRPDIVLADVRMPGLNGYEVCEHIRESAEWAATPVILLAGTFDPFDAQEAARVRCNGHLTKPFDMEELHAMVHALVGGGSGSVQPGAAAGALLPPAPDKRVLESFMGPDAILDIFGQQARAEAAPRIAQSETQASAAGIGASPVTDAMLEAIVERVVRRMSPAVIREVAWEVVPELSEVLIRRVIEEQNNNQ